MNPRSELALYGDVRAWLALVLYALLQETPESLRLPESEFARRRAAIQERFRDGAVAVDEEPGVR